MNNIFIISGPSGAGEDSIINGLENEIQIERVITTTTRKMRKGESQGKPYYFITKKEFEDGIRKGFFAEYALQYNGNLYGVSRGELERVANSGKIGIWKIDYKGVISVKKMFPEIKAIFINTPDLETLERRIRKRDQVSEEYISERMEYSKEWLKNRDIYDHQVINSDGKLKEAVAETLEIIKNYTNV